jgi:hypothetical protein
MTWALFPGDKHTRAVIEIIAHAQQPQGSERVIVILCGSMLEEHVNYTLKERLLDEPNLLENLIGIGGALGNLGPKIDLLRLLGVIDEKNGNALKGIAEVRNFFAHNMDASFDSLDRKFNGAMNRLTLHEGRTHFPHHLFGPDGKRQIEPIRSKRDQFIVNVQLGLIALMRYRVGHDAHTNRKRTDEELLAMFPNRYADEEPSS